MIVKDLKKCSVEEDWHEVAQDRRCLIRESAVEANVHDEQEEVKQKGERRRRREIGLDQENAALTCSEAVCGFRAVTRAGLFNHFRQKHQQPQKAQCSHCGRFMHKQGLHNHQLSAQIKLSDNQ